MDDDPTLVENFNDFVSSCLPGDSFPVPASWQEKMHEVRVFADARVRNRNDRLRIWLQGEPLRFECKFWAFDTEPKPYRKFKWVKKKTS